MAPSSRLRALGALALTVVLAAFGDARAQTGSHYLGCGRKLLLVATIQDHRRAGL